MASFDLTSLSSQADGIAAQLTGVTPQEAATICGLAIAKIASGLQQTEYQAILKRLQSGYNAGLSLGGVVNERRGLLGVGET